MTDTETHKKNNGTIIDPDTFDNMFKKMECKAFLSEEDIKTCMILLDLKDVTVSGHKNINGDEHKMKSNMLGAAYDYSKIYSAMKKCKKYLDCIEYSLSEDPWYCWEGETLKNEHEIFKKVNSAYQALMKELSEAIGSESQC